MPPTVVLVDAGPMVALFDPRDRRVFSLDKEFHVYRAGRRAFEVRPA